MVILGWSQLLKVQRMKVELTIVVDADGFLCAMTPGTIMMPRWYVASWDSMWKVSLMHKKIT